MVQQRDNVRIDPEQYKRLKADSDKTKVPIAAIVRQAIDAWYKLKK
jgi:predicted DNA-binding protein